MRNGGDEMSDTANDGRIQLPPVRLHDGPAWLLVTGGDARYIYREKARAMEDYRQQRREGYAAALYVCVDPDWELA